MIIIVIIINIIIITIIIIVIINVQVSSLKVQLAQGTPAISFGAQVNIDYD